MDGYESFSCNKNDLPTIPDLTLTPDPAQTMKGIRIKRSKWRWSGSATDLLTIRTYHFLLFLLSIFTYLQTAKSLQELSAKEYLNLPKQDFRQNQKSGNTGDMGAIQGIWGQYRGPGGNTGDLWAMQGTCGKQGTCGQYRDRGNTGVLGAKRAYSTHWSHRPPW